MPAYEICYLDDGGNLTYKFSATCDSDQRAKILAHAMKLPSMKRLEVWSGKALIYARPQNDQPRQSDPSRIDPVLNRDLAAAQPLLRAS